MAGEQQASDRSGFSPWRTLRYLLIIFLATVALTAAFLWDDVVVIIRSGEAGVLWRIFSGTEVDRVYGEGVRVISPFDRMTVYNVRKQIVDHDLVVLSQDGLKVGLKLTIRYRPEVIFLGVLHDRIGPEYLTRIVVPQTESALRTNLGNATAEQIYTNENNLLNNALLETMEAIERNFLEVEDIIIREIRLPEIVRTAIEDKLIQKEILASYVFRGEIAVQEARRKRIEAQGIRDYNELIDATLSPRLLRYQGITVTTDIADSANAKTVVIGAGSDSPPVVLSTMPPTIVNTHPQETRKEE